MKKLFEEDYIHIIDDFYPDLSWLNLASRKFVPVPGANYSGLRAEAPDNVEATRARIKELLGMNLSFGEDGYLRAQRRSDQGQEKRFIHFDKNKLVILVYLSDPPAGEDPHLFGTNFYRSKVLGSTRYARAATQEEEMEQRRAIAENSNNLEAWEKWLTVPFKKNRALIYDGNLFHSPGTEFFGVGVHDARLIQNFFAKVL